MANPNLNEKSQNPNFSNTLQDATSTVRESARDAVRGVRESVSSRINSMDASEMMDRAGERANQFYSDATDWMRDNSRTLYIVGGFAAVGVIGFLLGRNLLKRSSDIENF